jgi:nicotinate-nucleotide adenylyltransferase
MSARRIGLLGGTFDPIHCGHLDLAGVAQAALRLDRMLIITANIPPHRPQPAASAYHRFAMVALAVAGRSDWRAADLELRCDAPSYTSTTLDRFHERGYTPSELYFVIGADAFADIATWRDYPRILDGTHFAVVSRPGFPVGELAQRLPSLAPRMTRPRSDTALHVDPLILLIDEPTADVSSSAIRRRLTAAESIDGLVPPSVAQHIEQHGLYTSMTPGRRASDVPRILAADRLHGED